MGQTCVVRKRFGWRVALRIHVSQQGKCAYCRKVYEVDEAELDHVVPPCEGGEDDPSNLVFACSTCNRAKNKHPAEWFRMCLEHNASTGQDLSLGEYRRSEAFNAAIHEIYGDVISDGYRIETELAYARKFIAEVQG